MDWLDGKQAIFGKVVEGIEVLKKLNHALCDDNHRPFKDILIKHTIILDDPFDDPAGMNFPESSPPPSEELIKAFRIGDDDFEKDQGLDEKELEKRAQQAEINAKALTLEMVGDLPFAGIC